MNTRSSRFAKRSGGLFRGVEVLERRAYLNGIELGAPISTPVGGLSPSSISMTTVAGANADFNGDGKTDLVVVSDINNNSKVGLYLGNGDGSFQSPVTAAVQANAGSVAIADMNGDGKLDIVTGGTGSVSIVHGDGAGGLGTATNIATGVTGTAIAVADLNGDGLMDIVTADASFAFSDPPVVPGATQALSSDATTVAVLIQQPDGSFVQQNISPTVISSIAVGDFNGDGRPDLALTLEQSDAIGIMLNNGDGTFGAATQYPAGDRPVSLVAADFNGDGKLDLASLDTTDTISFLAGNGDGTFKSAVSSLTILSLVNTPAPMVAAHLNSSDTAPDLLLFLPGHVGEPGGVVALNNGDGTFRFGTDTADANGFEAAVAAGKLKTGDTLNDVVVADLDALTSFFNVTSQDTTPPTASLSALPVPEPAAPTVQFTVNFADDKQVDFSTVSANSITVTGPDGTVLPATLIKAIPVTTSVQATYQITFSGQYYGTYTFTAATSGPGAVRDANGNALANSVVGTFNVLPPAQTSFTTTVALTGQFPQTVAAGAKGSMVKVTVSAGPGQSGFFRPDDCVVTLAASLTNTFTSNSIILGQIERRVSTATHNMTVPFKKWNYPTIAGNYFIVATTSLTVVSASSPNAINVQPVTVSLKNLWSGATSNIVRHGRIDFSFQVQNTGTATANGILLVDLVATAPGYGSIYPMMENVRVNIAPGRTQTIHLHVVPKAVPSGTYDLSLALNPLTGFNGTSITSNIVTGTNSVTL